MLRSGLSIRYRITMILSLHFWEFVRKHGRWIRPAVFDNVRKILLCRTPALGCHMYGCLRCDQVHVVPHSCKSRFCTSCGKHRTDVWADSVLNGLLDVPYHHLVLSCPWQLRSTVMQNRKVGLNALFRAAILSITDWANKVHGMRMGVIAVMHTFGSDMRVHPHIHLIVTGGGLLLDGSRWVETDPRFLMPHGGLKKRWRYHVVRLLTEAHRNGQLHFFGSCSFLGRFPRFKAMLNKLYQLTWYAHIGASLLDPRFSVRYIGRYTKRAVLAEYRITHYDGKIVRFAFKDYAQGGKTAYKTLPVLAFIGRLVRHIPDKHFPMIRHAGLFCSRWKRRYLEQARHAIAAQAAHATPRQDNAAAQQPPASPPLSLQSWRQRQIQTLGRDPLTCTRCQIPMVLLGVVFGPHIQIEALFLHAQLPLRPWQSPGPTATNNDDP